MMFTEDGVLPSVTYCHVCVDYFCISWWSCCVIYVVCIKRTTNAFMTNMDLMCFTFHTNCRLTDMWMDGWVGIIIISVKVSTLDILSLITWWFYGRIVSLKIGVWKFEVRCPIVCVSSHFFKWVPNTRHEILIDIWLP